jgi:hypothetical protein
VIRALVSTYSSIKAIPSTIIVPAKYYDVTLFGSEETCPRSVICWVIEVRQLNRIVGMMENILLYLLFNSYKLQGRRNSQSNRTLIVHPSSHHVT